MLKFFKTHSDIIFHIVIYICFIVPMIELIYGIFNWSIYLLFIILLITTIIILIILPILLCLVIVYS